MSIHKKIREYAYDLVANGKILYSQLNNKEKEKFSGLLWSSYPLSDCYSPICDADFKNEIPYLLAEYMQSNDINFDEKIILIMKNNCIKYFSETMQVMLDEQYSEYKFNLKYDGEKI